MRMDSAPTVFQAPSQTLSHVLSRLILMTTFKASHMMPVSPKRNLGGVSAIR